MSPRNRVAAAEDAAMSGSRPRTLGRPCAVVARHRDPYLDRICTDGAFGVSEMDAKSMLGPVVQASECPGRF
jgi:hypothetical protein